VAEQPWQNLPSDVRSPVYFLLGYKKEKKIMVNNKEKLGVFSKNLIKLISEKVQIIVYHSYLKSNIQVFVLL